jgi:putative tricarboxylic transport membrane protein
VEPGTAFASLLALTSSPLLLGLMLAAVVVGMLFGALPGVGGKTAIALAIPFVFGMPALPGAVFLVAMHAVVHTGGAIPGILFGIPGGAPDAATVVDGHPLARQGQAGRALGASLGASAVGGVIGAVALAAFLPVLRPLALSFGPAETFLLAMIGISFIATLSGGKPIAAFAVGCLGLLCSFVGMDPQSGIPRFAFGQLFLWDGVDVTTAMLGVFAVPEMVALAGRGGSVSALPPEAAHYSSRQLWQGMADVWRHRWLTLRTSLIGVVIGLVPGLGGDVASWVCYGHAVSSSREPERFGKGAIEGVIAPETANNSKEGGALVPTLFFGVPGSSGMVLLLGAFTVLGISPGPTLLLGDGELVWTLVFALALSNLLAVAVFLGVAPWLGRLAFVRGTRVVPVVFLLTIVGSLAVAAIWQTLLVLLVLGVFGWALQRCGWPRAPFAIGLVLGEIAEVALHQSLTIWGPSFLLRPTALALLAIGAIGLAIPFWRARGRTSHA